jgi:solute:Na+ symporter, SSS family
VLAVLVFKDFPTVYEAHGFFHSTLTPPLVVAIFLGIFWRKFTPAAVITTFLGGVTLMILGANYPGILIAPFDHGIEMDPVHPYSYIRALYNLVVCAVIAVAATLTTNQQKRIVAAIKAKSNHNFIISTLTIAAAVIFVGLVFSSSILTLHPESYPEISIMIIFALILSALVAVCTNYFVKYDEQQNTFGLTAWTIDKAKEMFKGRKLNDIEGTIVKAHWKLKPGDEDTINFSRNDMAKMKAEEGDLVYISDARKWLGGLKSVHAVFGEPHDEDGVVYITEEHSKNGQFVPKKLLAAEKEM